MFCRKAPIDSQMNHPHFNFPLHEFVICFYAQFIGKINRNCCELSHLIFDFTEKKPFIFVWLLFISTFPTINSLKFFPKQINTLMHSNDFRCAKFCQWRPSRWFCKRIKGVGVMCIPRRSQSMQWAFAPKDKLVATCRNTLCIFSATSSISALNRCWHIAFILCKLHFAQRKCVHAKSPSIPLGMGEWESSGGVFERFPIRFVIWFFFLKIGLFFWFFFLREKNAGEKFGTNK